MSKRPGVTVRFNAAQQRELMELLEFWGQKGFSDPKKVIRFAIDQLLTSTRQLKARLEKEELSEQQQSSEPVSQPSSVAETAEEPTEQVSQ